MLNIETTPAANSDKVIQPDALVAFVAGVAQMNLKAPPGVSAQAYHAKRLREVRNAARFILHYQIDELAQVLAKMLADGRVIYTGESGFSVVEEPSQ